MYVHINSSSWCFKIGVKHPSFWTWAKFLIQDVLIFENPFHSQARLNISETIHIIWKWSSPNSCQRAISVKNFSPKQRGKYPLPTMIFAGSDSFTSFEQEILRIGPKINASRVWSMICASWSSSLEKRQSHQTVELIKCAFEGQR